MKDPIRFAVIGARRGQTFIASARELAHDNVQLTAICDTLPTRRAEWENEPGVRCYEQYEDVLADREVDAICLATPVPLHARQAIAALEAGKHVLCEVTAATTLEEGRELIAAVERTGLTYMMAENYCFREPVLQVQRMVEEGVFGDLVYATGAYIHDCRKLFFTPEGEMTWRGDFRKTQLGNAYPTHSLGPVARWLGINQRDHFERLATWQSRAVAASHFAQRNYPQADPAPLIHPDTTDTSIHTTNGVLVQIRVDWASARPHMMMRHELQGTRAAFCWPDGPGTVPEPLIWIEGRSPAADDGTPKEWEPLSRYAAEYGHPLWQEHGETARRAGHGGGDYFVLREFVEAIRQQRRPLIDVYDAVTWSALTPLSGQSVAAGNAPVAYPRFQP